MSVTIMIKLNTIKAIRIQKVAFQNSESQCKLEFGFVSELRNSSEGYPKLNTTIDVQITRGRIKSAPRKRKQV